MTENNNYLKLHRFLPARRYASVGISYGPDVSVCLSVTSRCSLEVVGRIELVFGMEASFDQSYTDLENFATAYR